MAEQVSRRRALIKRRRNRIGPVFGVSLLPRACEDGVCYTPSLPLGDNVYTQTEALKHIEQQLQANKGGKQRPAKTLENILTILDQTALQEDKANG